MSIIDAKSVQIGISTRADERISRLKLDYQGQTYDLLRVVAAGKLNPGRAGSQWQQAIDATPTGCLVVAEANYYSLWTIERAISTPPTATQQAVPMAATRLELQQASIWLLQELWVQWESSLGVKQLPIIAEEIVAATPALQSRRDFDRLLAIDPWAEAKLEAWRDKDFELFDRHLYDIAQHKLGRQFGTELTIEIVRSMPALLQATLAEILEL
ncbi:hypothetical protein [Chamaesiphon sp. VAR_69_metabat_338]|uniref:Npun_F0813 family protein n=1 Tax=Chamaesiphon sp. VAR_69_metabat_338 TaxID=2964704 RepID=UPI00286E0630|nr:hypothetical protein [Chamaesiphon sp. VAR_69_metabat_338]